jgi:hypothetical protein
MELHISQSGIIEKKKPTNLLMKQKLAPLPFVRHSLVNLHQGYPSFQIFIFRTAFLDNPNVSISTRDLKRTLDSCIQYRTRIIFKHLPEAKEE